MSDCPDCPHTHHHTQADQLRHDLGHIATYHTAAALQGDTTLKPEQTRHTLTNPIPGGTAHTSWVQGADITNTTPTTNSHGDTHWPLGYWVATFQAWLGHNHPTPRHVETICDWLTHHLHNLTNHPNIDDFTHTVRRTLRQARYHAGLTNPPATRIPCPRITDQGPCPGTARFPHDHPPTQPINCDTCHQPMTYLQVRHIAEADSGHDKYVDRATIADIAARRYHHTITDNTIRSWAHRGHIKTRPDGLIELASFYQYLDTRTAAT